MTNAGSVSMVSFSWRQHIGRLACKLFVPERILRATVWRCERPQPQPHPILGMQRFVLGGEHLTPFWCER